MQITGARMVIEALIKEKVDTVFGYPGGAIMNIYDEVFKQDKFRHILTRHEQAAIHAAEGYAKSSGKVGVAFITSGPGFTNAVTGIADAYMDSVPLVVISGQVPLTLIGTDAFQEVDAVGISRPCTKHNYLVTKIEDLPRVIKEAFYIASSGRPGPVHIDIPKDITAKIAEFNYPKEIKMKTYNPTYKGNINQIKKVIKILKEAKKPILYIGGGAIHSQASKLIKEFINLTGIPAVETLMARGVLKHDDEYLINMLGMHGSYAANISVSESDLLIAIGARFDDRVTGKASEFAKRAKIVHIDIDPSNISKLVNSHYPIVGDLNNVLKDLIKIIKQDEDFSPKKHIAWRKTIKNYDSIHPLNFKDSNKTLKPQWVIKRIEEITGDKAIISTDVGQHQMWTAQFYPFSRPRQWITSGGLGTMGFGFPAAIGVKRANPNNISINITGDGSILMNIQELMTSVESKLPVINIILNNNYLGMVRQWQNFFYEERYSETDLYMQPNFEKLAKSFGGIGFIVKNKKEFDEALKESIKKDLVSIIDVKIDRLENVLPMVPAGGSSHNMMGLKSN